MIDADLAVIFLWIPCAGKGVWMKPGHRSTLASTGELTEVSPALPDIPRVGRVWCGWIQLHPSSRIILPK